MGPILDPGLFIIKAMGKQFNKAVIVGSKNTLAMSGFEEKVNF
jgi:hypothetical protein